MTDTITPPSPSVPPVQQGQGGPGSGVRTALLTAGSAVIAGLIVLGAVQVAQTVNVEDASGTYRVPESFRSLVVDTSAADVMVRYSDSVSSVVMEFESGGSALRFDHEVQGDALRVSVRPPGFWPFGGLFSLGSSASLDVVLPAELEPVALDLESSAGSIVADGDFAAVTASTSAGDIGLSGSASSLDLETSAGSTTGADLDVTGPVRADSSAGDTTLAFVSLPSSMSVSSSAGNVRVALPDGDYEIRTDTSVGSVDLGVASTPGADRVYRFDTSAGDVTLEPAAR